MSRRETILRARDAWLRNPLAEFESPTRVAVRAAALYTTASKKPDDRCSSPATVPRDKRKYQRIRRVRFFLDALPALSYFTRN